MLHSHSIKVAKSIGQNPQLNAIIERIYQIMLSMLQVLDIRNFSWDDNDRIWKDYLGKSSWAIYSICSTASKYSLVQLAFNWNMILNMQTLID